MLDQNRKIKRQLRKMNWNITLNCSVGMLGKAIITIYQIKMLTSDYVSEISLIARKS